MELTGLLHVIYDTQVVSEKYKKRDFVLKTDFDSQYPQLVQLQLGQDKCDLLKDFRVGDFVKVQFNVRGREWNGPQGVKYFNTLEAWSVSLIPNRNGDGNNNTAATTNNNAATASTPQQQESATAAAPVFNSGASNNDDLPF